MHAPVTFAMHLYKKVAVSSASDQLNGKVSGQGSLYAGILGSREGGLRTLMFAIL